MPEALKDLTEHAEEMGISKSKIPTIGAIYAAWHRLPEYQQKIAGYEKVDAWEQLAITTEQKKLRPDERHLSDGFRFTLFSASRKCRQKVVIQLQVDWASGVLRCPYLATV